MSFENLAQATPAPVEQESLIPGTDGEKLAHLVAGESLHVTQHHDLTLTRR